MLVKRRGINNGKEMRVREGKEEERIGKQEDGGRRGMRVSWENRQLCRA